MEALGGFLPSFVRMLVPAVGPQIRVRPLCWPRRTAGGRLRSGILRHALYCRLGPVDGYRPLGRLRARTRHDPARDGRTRMVQARRLGQLSVRHGLWRKAGPRQYPFDANASSLRGLDAWRIGRALCDMAFTTTHSDKMTRGKKCAKAGLAKFKSHAIPPMDQARMHSVRDDRIFHHANLLNKNFLRCH